MLLGAPIWLFALAALSIPVVIHLWNIKQGKTLKVGSIALFTESSPKSSRSFKLLDILLLALRCLALILLVFLLAAPLWHQHLKAGKAKGWLLIPKENFNAVYQRFKPAIDTFNKQGYELHYFDKGFQKADLAELLQHPGKDTAATKTANYWALARQLASRIPATLPAEIFTPNTINHFTGAKPQTGLAINWHTYTPADSVSTWLAGAWLTANGNIRVVQGTATPSGTSFLYNDIKNGGQPGSAYTVGVENGLPVISQHNSKITVDTTTRRMAIYADNSIVDAGYLKAALDAIAQLTLRKTVIKIYGRPNAIPANQDWLFWLSAKPFSATIVENNKNTFSYADGKVEDVQSWINNSDGNIAHGQPKIALHKIISTQTKGQAVWTDGFGNPILSLQQGKTSHYHFYSRFNPAWNDLVWNDAFPKWILDLTNNWQVNIGDHQRRAISAEQLQPTHISTTEAVTTGQTHAVELANYLWVALALTFVIERWLATKNKTVLANG